jgi:abortive infection bacteriophage resistance protein
LISGDQKFKILKPFPKPPITYEEQIDRLKQRGLQIIDEQKALHLLEKINYYRLSGYWYPLLQDKTNHIFKSGANFEIAFEIYKFDRELRLIVGRELEKIEVAVRSQIINILACGTSDSFWHTKPGLFRDRTKHNGCIEAMKKDFGKSDAQFIKAFKEKYADPLPPCWMVLDLLPFGTLSMLFENIKESPQKKMVADYFGLDKKTMTSWLHSFAYLRNICAHHARLWNRTMGITPRKPTNPKNQWLTDNTILNNRCYYFFSMILYFLGIVDPKNRFIFNLELLFKKYPNIDKNAMGFPANYDNEKLWTRNLTV